MEKVIGVNELRPKLGKYLDEAEKGETFVISSRSKLKGVLLGYSKYRELKELTEKAKRLEVSLMVNKFRDRASKAGLTEADVEEEIEKTRNS